ncbi:hypothetical protein T07_15035 [Trichinella nelsoni]|uniref:Uncharacterized protein n=1 Tax=Trichinella nelsoni TaxID=6336 RepID=A0A0V0SDW7_9BILA|nr:hypothetical protein T07_15035 [Trichinella nelsoni]
MLCKLIPPLTIIYLNEYCMGNQWKGCCIEVKSAVRSTCSALLVAIVSRAGTFFNADDRQVNFAHYSAFVNCLLMRFGCDVSKWRQMVRTVETYDMGVYFLIKEIDFRAEKLIISQMEIIMFGVQELSTVTLSMCHWNWDQKKCLEEEEQA